MNSVAIIDYGLCNLHSVARGVEQCGFHAVITESEEDVKNASRIILPGVGSFSDAMKNMQERKLDQMLRTYVLEKKIPLLGICLGMQLLGTKGLEGGNTEGLGFIEAEVQRLESTDPKERIPHIGWNEVHIVKESPLFTDIPSDHDFYFVHSYAVTNTNTEDVLATTPYCNSFASVIQKGHIYGTQFHPEKSQKLGLQLLRNFLTLC